MSLDDLLNEMNEKMKTRDLSDDYLREHNNSTREEIGIGEYAYGITMIPCKWVYEYLSDYKRVLKENERYKKSDYETICLENNELREITDRIQSEYKDLLKDNFKLKNELETKRKEYQETYEDIREELGELKKENEELNNRCRNLDKEAQAYLEELAGDNTLTRRTIKQLQEENEECKLDVQDYLKQAQENAEMYRKAQKKIQDLKAENEELKNDYENLSNSVVVKNHCIKNSIPVSLVKDKIEEIQEEGYWLFTTNRDSDKCVEVLQELLESEE